MSYIVFNSLKGCDVKFLVTNELQNRRCPKPNRRLFVTEFLQDYSPPSVKKSQPSRAFPSACKYFTAHSNLIHFDNCVLRDIYSIRKISVLFFTTILFSLVDKIWHESQAVLSLITACNLITTFPTSSRKDQGTQSAKQNFCNWTGNRRAIAKCTLIQRLLWKYNKTHRAKDQSKSVKAENYNSYRSPTSLISSATWNPSRAPSH